MQRLFGDLALAGRVEVEEFAACMGHAADLRDAQLKACFVASEVIADQLPVPVAEEVSSMFASTARAEVVNDRRQIGELAGGIRPNVSAMRFLRARRQHLYRRFVSVDDAVRQYGFAQRINQRLKLHAAVAHPLRQGRTGDGQPGAAKDFLLAIQRQMVGELGHHDVGQQPRSRDAFVDDVRRYRRLD
ncbi:hypothetical protein D3C78_1157390 [compost metagenome]